LAQQVASRNKLGTLGFADIRLFYPD